MATGVRLGRTTARPGPTCASIARIGVKELRNKNSVPTDAKLKPIDTRCVATGTSFAEIVATCTAMFVISGETGATHAEVEGR